MHLAVAALTAGAALTSVAAAHATPASGAGSAVGRYTAYQACQAAMWRWTAENVEDGSSVGSFRHEYRAEDVWREDGGWHVQLAGHRGEPVTANDSASYCVVAGTNAAPKITHYAYPR